MKHIAILGSTGSIGRSALAVVEAHRDRLRVSGLAAGRNGVLFTEQVERFRPRAISMGSAAALADVRGALPGTALEGIGVFAHGTHGLVEVATQPDVDIVLCASSGTAALEAVLAAIECGKTIALANKEVLVMAGGLVTAAARRHGVMLLPVDSEHSAIFQSLAGHNREEVRRLVLTASGGPLREVPAERLASVTPAEALRHPNWTMGDKITIDSATLMNKGLEVIEARWLFDVEPSRIEILVHPESIVHSMVEYVDGQVVAQLGVSDMRGPISYALAHPERIALDLDRLDLARVGRLTFEPPDPERFPAFTLAYRALEIGGTAPAVLSGADEAAVAAFLAGRLRFDEIARVCAEVLEAHPSGPVSSVEEAIAASDWGQAEAARRVARR
jgi:1-deoxy-D-xylulose-5-phosphate reductoisomerase